jgi:hypothetical protein
MPSYDRALWALRTWLDSWSGIGHVVVGIHRQGFDLQLTQYDDRGWRDLLHHGNGALANERDRHWMGAHAVARDATDGVGCAETRGVALGPLPHLGPESVLRLEERSLSFSDHNIGIVHQFLALPHEALRRLPQRLHAQPHFGWKPHAPVEVRADVLGEVLATSRAEVGTATTEGISGKFHHAEAESTGQALGDDVIRAIDEEQVALVCGQGSGPRHWTCDT